jgi:uncharacterized surface protein with fasciclin (FAS1) repeats
MNFRLVLSTLVAVTAVRSSLGGDDDQLQRKMARKPPTPAPTRAPTPAPVSSSCKSIKDIACGDDDFEILCRALKRTDLDDDLAQPGSFTVFAPTDDAFRNLFGSDAWRALRRLPGDALTDLLLYHVIDGDTIYFDDLERKSKYRLGSKSIYIFVVKHLQFLIFFSPIACCSKCRANKTFQVGRDNSYTDWVSFIKMLVQTGHSNLTLSCSRSQPEIIDKDIEACNGIIQVVNEVLLPKGFYDNYVQ